jgi:hypothetical protein
MGYTLPAGLIPDDGFERGRVTGWVVEVDQHSLLNLSLDWDKLDEPP